MVIFKIQEEKIKIMDKIKNYLQSINLKLLVIGIILGAVGGYAYYYFVGCRTGSCPITSNPYLMILYGAFFGAVLLFKRKKHEENE